MSQFLKSFEGERMFVLVGMESQTKFLIFISWVHTFSSKYGFYKWDSRAFSDKRLTKYIISSDSWESDYARHFACFLTCSNSDS